MFIYVNKIQFLHYLYDNYPINYPIEYEYKISQQLCTIQHTKYITVLYY